MEMKGGWDNKPFPEMKLWQETAHWAPAELPEMGSEDELEWHQLCGQGQDRLTGLKITQTALTWAVIHLTPSPSTLYWGQKA